MTLPLGPRSSASRERTQAQARARAAWADLGGRLSTVTPAAVGRAVLTVGVVALIFGFVAATWPTLLPFVIGGLVAYAVLPVVNALDRILPRALAAAVTMLAAVAALVGRVRHHRPAPHRGPPRAGPADPASRIPSTRPWRTRSAACRMTPAPRCCRSRRRSPTTVRSGLDNASGSLGSIAPAVFQAALGVVGALLGLLVLPAWLLTVLTDQRKARAAVDRRFAGWLRAGCLGRHPHVRPLGGDLPARVRGDLASSPAC